MAWKGHRLFSSATLFFHPRLLFFIRDFFFICDFFFSSATFLFSSAIFFVSCDFFLRIRLFLSATFFFIRHFLFYQRLSFFIQNASVKREKLCKKTLYSSTEFILGVSQTMLYHNQNLFLMVSYCFCSFGEFAEVFEWQVWPVRVVHLHSVARALSNPSRCFQIVNKSWQRFLSLSFMLRCYNVKLKSKTRQWQRTTIKSQKSMSLPDKETADSFCLSNFYNLDLRMIFSISIITQVIIEILALSLAENGAIFCFI